MRFTIHRQKERPHSRGLRIAITQDEITADLNHRGPDPRRAPATAPSGRGHR